MSGPAERPPVFLRYADDDETFAVWHGDHTRQGGATLPPPLVATVWDHPSGMLCHHDQHCPVCAGAPATLDVSSGEWPVWSPCSACQAEGWAVAKRPGRWWRPRAGGRWLARAAGRSLAALVAVPLAAWVADMGALIDLARFPGPDKKEDER